MRNLTMLLGTLLMATPWSSSPAQSLQWAGQWAGTYNAPVLAMCTDASGDLWATGFYQGDTDFDLGPGTMNLSGSPGGAWIPIAKYDPSGSLLWTGRLGNGTPGSALTWGSNIASDDAGGLIVAGQFSGASDFDPGPGQYMLDDIDLDLVYKSDVFVAKLDTSGAFHWAVQFGDSATDHCRDMVLDGDGNILLAFDLADTADMDPGPGTDILPVPSPGTDVLVKLDPNGGLLWYRDLGAIGPIPWIALGTDTNNTIWVTRNGDIRTFDEQGNLLWALPMEMIPVDMAVDEHGNGLICGSFEGTLDMDPGPGVTTVSASGNSDLFCAKLDPTGDLVWSIHLGGSAYTTGTGIALGPDGHVHLTGIYQAPLDLDPGPGTWPAVHSGEGDILVITLDSTGAFLNGSTLSAPGLDNAYGSVVLASSDLVLYGSFEGTLDVDPGPGVLHLNSSAYSDGLIARYSGMATSAGQGADEHHARAMPNPTDGALWLLDLPPNTCGVSVLNAQGAEVMRMAPTKGDRSMRLDLSPLAAGLHHVRVLTTSEVVTIKVVRSGN
ncbi:MAG: T9SS type A sorting domain-containing protein [Flavobacteriales bacterium]|jgi:hypothetical protein|nr:T9SS type A sorting domain-containing protein [Flavobacteriales bacterium]MBK7943042.1 T9SS type A sorting domain-containing protein [Flavobacteriales bacterium]MBK8947456.1 T9SS type A sorting domain-containing protein [Flavobacteriales bacterium]MBK9698554.1 T9SS type A sorting domain-containing protein [Flavobacteriales bacterium]